MRTWNYRLIKHTGDGGYLGPKEETWYSIHTVYYDNGVIWSYSEDQASPNSFETPEEVKSTLHMMLEAFDKPTLEIGTDGKLIEIKP